MNTRELRAAGYIRHVDRVTVAAVKVEGVHSQATERSRWFRAASIQHPGDKHDPEIAYLLSFGRALQKAGAYMVRQAEGKVKHADQRQRSRSESRAREGALFVIPPWVVEHLRSGDVVRMECSGDFLSVQVNDQRVAYRYAGDQDRPGLDCGWRVADDAAGISWVD